MIPVARVQAVLLDAAGTLIEIEPPGPRLRALLAERLGVTVSLEQACAAIGAEIAHYRAHMLEGSDPERLLALRHGCATVLRSALPATDALTAASLETLTEILLDALVFKPFPEVPDALVRLRAAGLRLVAASNWDCSLETVLERLGVRELVDGVVCSAVVGAAKPDPRLLRAALRLAGVGPDAAVHVGDSVAEDVGGALAADILPVLLRRDGGGRAGDLRRDPDPEPISHGWPALVIASLGELPTALGL